MKFSPIVIILSIYILCSFQVNAAVKWNNNSNTSAEKKLSPINLAKYNMFRKLDFDISGEQYKSFAAYNQGKDLLGFKASGILFFQDEVCNWRSRISNRKTKTGSFVANCPSGITVKGKYTYVGNNQGSYGSGKDNFGRLIKYVLGGVGSSNKREIQSHYNELKSKINSSTTQIASATTSSSAARASSIVVPEDNCGEVSLAEMNWASSQIMVAVDKLLLRAAFGCDVKVVSGTNISTFETMKRHSFPDVAGELWINGIYEQFKFRSKHCSNN